MDCKLYKRHNTMRNTFFKYKVLLSMNSLNKTQTAVFTLLLHILLPGDHINRIDLSVTILRQSLFNILSHDNLQRFQMA